MIIRTLCLAALLAALATPAAAQGDARTWALGGAGLATSRGVAAIDANPANLAFGPGVSINLLGAGFDVHNNAFSLSRYNEISGATLDETDKERLLADVPADGMRLDALVRASALGVQVGRFALTSGVLGLGRGNLDRDVFDLVLFGNELGETVDFQDTWGEAQAVGAVSLSYGQPVATGQYGVLDAGLNVRYLRGLYEMHVEEAYGQLTTGYDAITSDAAMTAVTAEGGAGYAVDLGLALRTRGGWAFGFVADNVASRISWTDNPERHSFAVTAEDINATQDDFDAAVSDHDTTTAAASYTTRMPLRLRAGASHDTGRWLLVADIAQGLRDQAGGSTRTQLAVGAEWRPLGFLTPRAGLTLGGTAGSALTGGLGLRLAAWQLDLAVMNRGGLSPRDSRGIGFAMSTRLVF